MAKERIFIHIPKTGGTTLDCAVKGKQWMNNTQDLYYRHISNDTKRSNAGDILEKSNFSKYKNYDIYTMLRTVALQGLSVFIFKRAVSGAILKGLIEISMSYFKSLLLHELKIKNIEDINRIRDIRDFKFIRSFYKNVNLVILLSLNLHSIILFIVH